MSGKASRRKGHEWEREVARIMRDAMPGADVRRGLQSRSGSDAADVVCPRFWIEAKRGRMPNPRAALQQATLASEADGNGKVPVAVIRDDRRPAFVVLALDDFVSIVEELSNGDS